MTASLRLICSPRLGHRLLTLPMHLKSCRLGLSSLGPEIVCVLGLASCSEDSSRLWLQEDTAQTVETEVKDLKPEVVAHYTLASNTMSLVEFLEQGYKDSARKSEKNKESQSYLKGTFHYILNRVFDDPKADNPMKNQTHGKCLPLRAPVMCQHRESQPGRVCTLMMGRRVRHSRT